MLVFWCGFVQGKQLTVLLLEKKWCKKIIVQFEGVGRSSTHGSEKKTQYRKATQPYSAREEYEVWWGRKGQELVESLYFIFQ